MTDDTEGSPAIPATRTAALSEEFSLPDWILALEPRSRHRITLQAGQVLFREGQRASAIYLILAGEVRLVRYLEDGTSATLHTGRSGDTFAEAALFTDIYHCDAIADCASDVLAVNKQDMLAGIAASPEIGLYFSRVLAIQVRKLRASLMLRDIRSAAARVLAWLRLQAQGNPPEVIIERAWIDIATELGLSHEVVYRTLATLQKQGVIRRHGNRIVLAGGFLREGRPPGPS